MNVFEKKSLHFKEELRFRKFHCALDSLGKKEKISYPLCKILHKSDSLYTVQTIQINCYATVAASGSNPQNAHFY